jgi:hypothetical protein
MLPSILGQGPAFDLLKVETDPVVLLMLGGHSGEDYGGRAISTDCAHHPEIVTILARISNHRARFSEMKL